MFGILKVVSEIYINAVTFWDKFKSKSRGKG